MDFLKRLFGGGGPSAGRDGGMYLYVQPKACNEILRLRIDLNNNLSRTDDGKGLWVRKLARGARCPFEVEIIIHFDNNRRVTSKEIVNGTFVTEEDYLAQQQAAEEA